MLIQSLSNKFKSKGQNSTGSHDVVSGTTMTTIFSTTCAESGVYVLVCKIEIKAKNCDVAFRISVNGSGVTQRQFRAPSEFASIDTLETIQFVNKGDIISIEACQNSGATVTANYKYNYRQ